LDAAIDAYFNDSSSASSSSQSRPVGRAPPSSEIVKQFNKYKGQTPLLKTNIHNAEYLIPEKDGDDITVDGTMKFCEDLEVDPEDVVLLALAYELKSPRMAIWTKQGWVEGWKNLSCVHNYLRLLDRNFISIISCDNLGSMRQVLPGLRRKLGSDREYFTKVYNHTFDFSRNEGQRSLGQFHEFKRHLLLS